MFKRLWPLLIIGLLFGCSNKVAPNELPGNDLETLNNSYLRYSYNPDRSNDAYIAYKKDIRPSVCVFFSEAQVPPGGQVSFYLDDILVNTDSTAPYDMGGGTITACNKVKFTLGKHTIKTKVNGVPNSEGTFTVINEDDPNRRVNLATSSTRSVSSDLNGTTVAGDVYIYAQPTDVKSVDFRIDGVSIRVETVGPFDLGGTASDGTALPYNTSGLSNGSHTMQAVITLLNNSVVTENAAFVVVNSGAPPVRPSCLNAGTGQLVTLTGPQRNTSGSTGYSDRNLPDGVRIDARNATFINPDKYPLPASYYSTWESFDPILIDIPLNSSTARNGLCLSGGVYDPGLGLTNEAADVITDWQFYHHSQGIQVWNTKNAVVEGAAIMTTGDGITFGPKTDNWTFRDSYIRHSGDDGIENGLRKTGLVDNVLVDWVYHGIACRMGSPTDAKLAANPPGTMTIQNSLLAMKRQIATYNNYPSPSHLSIYKWEIIPYTSPGCKLVLKNNVFIVDDPKPVIPEVDYQIFAKPEDCSNNVIVWTGSGEYGYPIPYCFTLVRDRSFWVNARDVWFANHAYLNQYMDLGQFRYNEPNVLQR